MTLVHTKCQVRVVVPFFGSAPNLSSSLHGQVQLVACDDIPLISSEAQGSSVPVQPLLRFQPIGGAEVVDAATSDSQQDPLQRFLQVFSSQYTEGDIRAAYDQCGSDEVSMQLYLRDNALPLF
eukprot:m.167813 g.167813  ORF g.167813 m.167813 type:complete len:123 (+) comp14467_c1_seq1:353-721(+)